MRPGREDLPIALGGVALTVCVIGVALTWSSPAAAAGPTVPAPARGPVALPPPPGTGDPLGMAALAQARVDLASGIHEQGGNNRGPEIEALYLKPLSLAPGSAWCAAALWSWVRRGAVALGVKVPNVPQTGRARFPIPWFQKNGLWVPATPGMRVHPGWVAIWDRSIDGKPETTGNGHTGITAGFSSSGAFPTIEGNSGPNGDRVDGKFRPLDDPRLLGFGRFA